MRYYLYGSGYGSSEPLLSLVLNINYTIIMCTLNLRCMNVITFQTKCQMQINNTFLRNNNDITDWDQGGDF